MGFYVTEAFGDDEKLIYYRSTPRGRYAVKDTTMGGERIRLLLVNDTQESATYLDEGKKYQPLFRYLDNLREVLDSHPDPKKVLLTGGAGFAFPKLFFSSGYGGELTVVEIDPRMIRLARRYFFLNDLERDFDLKRNGRLKIIEGEALNYITNSEEKYDVILNDAYLGNVIDQGLISDEGIAQCKAHLSPGGILAYNVITPLAGEGSLPAIMARKRMGMHFDRCSLYACDPSCFPTIRQNCILIGFEQDARE